MGLGIGTAVTSTFMALGLEANLVSAAAVYTGFISGSFEDYKAVIDPVDIALDDGTFVNSGMVTFDLDINKPSSFLFDFDNLTYSYNVGLLVNIEALTLLGQPSQKISVSFTGPITSTIPLPDEAPINTIFDLTIFANPINGGGTFDSGQFLSGWRYENVVIIQNNTTNVTIETKGDNNKIKCEPNSTSDADGKVDGNLVTPGGKKTPIKGEGTTKSKRRNSPGGLDCSVPIPESSPSLISYCLFAFSILLTSKLRLKKLRSYSYSSTRLPY